MAYQTRIPTKEEINTNHAGTLERDEKVFELMKKGQSIIEIANALQIQERDVSRSLGRLINEGKLTTRELVKEPRLENGEFDKTTSKYIAQRNKVVDYLRLGWRSAAIREVLDIMPSDLDIYMRDIKAKGLMTAEQIKLAKKMKKETDLLELEKYIKEGKSIGLFRKLHPELYYDEVGFLIRQLIQTGRVTSEQVDKNRLETARNKIRGNSTVSINNQIDFIFDKVKKGYTPKEIVESDETKSITIHRVVYHRKRFIAEGIITREEMDAAIKKHREQLADQKNDELVDKIKEYTKKGYSLIEIARELGYNYTDVSRIKSEYAKLNGWFTKEELAEFRKQRMEREKAKELARQSAELEELESKREKSEKEIKRQQDENKKITKQQQEASKKMEKEKRQRIQYYAEEYRRVKKLAKNEDKQEIDGEENVSLSGRKEFLNLLTKLFAIGAIIPDSDIEIILNTIYLHQEFANKDSLKLLIFNAVRGKGMDQAEKMVATLISELESTRFNEPLWQYRKWIQRQKLLPQIAQMKEQGLSNTTIGERLGITSAEVMVFFEKAEEKPEFFENESR